MTTTLTRSHSAIIRETIDAIYSTDSQPTPGQLQTLRDNVIMAYTTAIGDARKLNTRIGPMIDALDLIAGDDRLYDLALSRLLSLADGLHNAIAD